MLTTFAFGEIFWAQRQPFSGMSNLVFYCLAFDKVLITLLGAKINVTTKQSGHWHCLIYRCMAVWLCAQPCLTLYDPMDDSLPGSSVHGIFQARILPFPIPGDLPNSRTKPMSVASPSRWVDFLAMPQPPQNGGSVGNRTVCNSSRPHSMYHMIQKANLTIFF